MSPYWFNHHKNLQVLATVNGKADRTQSEGPAPQIGPKRKASSNHDLTSENDGQASDRPRQKKLKSEGENTPQEADAEKQVDTNRGNAQGSRQPFNPREGIEAAMQLGESVDSFLARLPPSTTTIEDIGPWIWVDNFYLDRSRAQPDGAAFRTAGDRLLEEYRDKRDRLEGEGIHKATVTKKMYPDRLRLEHELLETAKSYGVTCGKWMLFPSPDYVDNVWLAIVRATAAGELGSAAKVATGDGSGTPTRLICVYTGDFSDKEDVKRVLMKLDQLGLARRGEQQGIYYKADAYTHMEINSGNEYKLRASMYSSKDVFDGKM